MNFSIGPVSDDTAMLVEKYHYSGVIPAAVQLVGSFRLNGGLFGHAGPVVAAIFFTIPPTRWSEEVWELARLIRTDECSEPLTALISKACGRIRKKRLVDLLVSFADPTHGHHGGIYQAASWNYDGKRDRTMDGIIWNGQFIPGRSANHRWGTRSPERLREIGVTAEPHFDEGKHLYWRPLNTKGLAKAKRLGLQSKPYPKPHLSLTKQFTREALEFSP